MAKRRKVDPRKIDITTLRSGMRRHLEQLGLFSIEEYKIWCREHKISCGLNKSTRQLRDELDLITTKKIEGLMTAEKKSRNLKDIIQKIHNGELNTDEIRNDTAREIAQVFQNNGQSDLLVNLMMFLEENSELFEDKTYIRAIHAISKYADRWIRPIDTWCVKRHNRNRQFADLLRHLFAAYDIPLFMDSVWLTDNSTHHKWYIHIGSGQNIRSAPDLPVTLTKKMAHHFLSAPKHYTVEEAIRLGQVHALGGDKRLMEALRGTSLISDFKNDEFWLSVIRFFIANPMLDINQVHPILDFIWNQKFENQQVFGERGIVEEIDPPQPNFTMKGRTAKTLLHQMNDWHRQLGKETREGEYQWKRSEIGELYLTKGKKKHKDLKIWKIRELLSTHELRYESSKLNHCVSSYGKSCFAGKTSIWTLEFEEQDELNKLLTIEVSLPDKVIRQVRGNRNRLPTLSEKNVLTQWATKENLRISSYVRFE